MLQRIRQYCPFPLSLELIAAALLLAVGAALRLYDLGELPRGFNNDEAAAAYDAWALLHYGIDRNGFSWPVHFVSWGGGQNALYSYLAMPFIAWGGLTAAVFRLPMALTGILSLFLMWKIGEKAAGRPFALLVLLLLALNSWHLIASRWALENNFLPFVILLSVYFLSRPDRDRFSIQAAAVFTLALSVYAYSAAYAFAPLFLGLVLVWLWLNRLADWRRLLALAALAGVVAAPIMLLVVINFFDLDTISVLGVSIPRYSGQPRYEYKNLLFLGIQGNWAGFLGNAAALPSRLLVWDRVLIHNTMPGFPPLLPYTILLSLVGMAVVLYQAKTRRDYGVHLLVVFWFSATLLVALISPANSTRLNALWLPAFYLIALGTFYIGQRRRVILYALAAAYVAYGSIFVYQYFRNYADLSAGVFHSGYGPALQRAVSAAAGAGIYAGFFNEYIHVQPLIHNLPSPQEYLETRLVAEPNARFKLILAHGQFVFLRPWQDHPFQKLLQSGGIDLDTIAHYVLTAGEVAEVKNAVAGLVTEQYGNYYYAYDPARVAASPGRGPLLQVDRPPVTEPPAARGEFDIYLEDNTLTYYKQDCTADDTRDPFLLHIIPVNTADLPAARRQLGFANQDFLFDDYGALYGRNCWVTVPLPDYPVASIRTGRFVGDAANLWQTKLWQVEFPGKR